MRLLNRIGKKVAASRKWSPPWESRPGPTAGGPSANPARSVREGDRSGRKASRPRHRAAAAAFLLLSAASAPAAELVMVEEQGCPWCARWDAEIAPVYPRTPEGQRAPLRRIGLHDPRPDDLTFDAPLRVTPTFVLVENGKEVARIEGYPGEDFFWPLLGDMLDELPDPPE